MRWSRKKPSSKGSAVHGAGKSIAAPRKMREMPIPAQIYMRTGDLAVFHQVARSLTSSFDLDTILRTILEDIEQFIQAELWMLLLPDPATGEMYCASAGGRDQKAVEMLYALRMQPGDGLAGWVMQHGETLILPEIAHDPRAERQRQLKNAHIHSVLAMPLRGRTSTLGVIEIYNPKIDQLADEAILFMHILADYAAIAIENAQDVSRIHQLTITDDVTGLYNTRHLYASLEREVKQSEKNGGRFALALIDLDHFKQVNDRYGHLAGSELLQRVGQRMRQLCRPQDLCFRYGGDEFVVLMPETEKHEALKQMKHLHSSLCATQFPLEATMHAGLGPGIHESICSSVGVSCFPEDGQTVHAVLASADQRMYKIKAGGRGRVAAE